MNLGESGYDGGLVDCVLWVGPVLLIDCCKCASCWSYAWIGVDSVGEECIGRVRVC